jgi:hypothetical protein
VFAQFLMNSSYIAWNLCSTLELGLEETCSTTSSCHIFEPCANQQSQYEIVFIDNILSQFRKLVLSGLCSRWPNKNASLQLSTKCNEFPKHFITKICKKRREYMYKHVNNNFSLHYNP